MAENEVYVHLETDGKIFTVDPDGNGPCLPVPGRTSQGIEVRLPTPEEARSAKLKWNVKSSIKVQFGIRTISIQIASPIDVGWPDEWAWKDDVISDSSADPVLRESVYRTIHRLVSKVIVENERGDVLIGKVRRGFFVGQWTLLGGYLDHGEHPARGAQREALEEAGISLEISEGWEPRGWTHIDSQIFTNAGLNYVSFTYRSSINSSVELIPKPDEISELAWVPIGVAIRRVGSAFDRSALEKLLEDSRS